MEIGNVLRREPWLEPPPRTARGAMSDPTRAWWRVQPRLPTQKRGQFLHYMMDVIAKQW